MSHLPPVRPEDVNEVSSFAIQLLRRTRPELSENHLRIIANDLVTRAKKRIYPHSDQPFQFGVPESRPSLAPVNKDRLSQIKWKKSIQEGRSVFERLYETKTTASSLKLRPKNETVQPAREMKTDGRKRGSLAPSCTVGAPDAKKKRASIVVPPNNVACKKDVFERLYASRGVEHKRSRQRNASSSSTDTAESLGECVGSVQRALYQLNLQRGCR
nr:unnamed protein product [Callosobruchus chinensis]